MNGFSRRKLGLVAGGTVALGVGGAPAASGTSRGPRPHEVQINLPAGNKDPLFADGVGVGSAVAVYTTSGLGPAAANPSAPLGSPEQFIDLSVFPGGALPPGVTVTEAQAWNILSRIVANLGTAGLRPKDVITVKCYLKRPAGASDADYAAWNRAYRQFFANTDLRTGEPILVPAGTGAPALPKIVNPARPARATVEVAGLVVPGWLMELEVQAAYPAR